MQRKNENPTHIIIKYAINGAWIGASIPVCGYQLLAYLDPHPGSFLSLTNSGEFFDFTLPLALLFNTRYSTIGNSFRAECMDLANNYRSTALPYDPEYELQANPMYYELTLNDQSKYFWDRDKKIGSIYGFSLLAATGAVGGAAVGATIATVKCITQQLYDAFIANRPTVSPKNFNRLIVGASIAGAGVSFATGWGFFVGALWGGMAAKTVEVISKPCRKTS